MTAKFLLRIRPQRRLDIYRQKLIQFRTTLSSGSQTRDCRQNFGDKDSLVGCHGNGQGQLVDLLPAVDHETMMDRNVGAVGAVDGFQSRHLSWGGFFSFFFLIGKR